MTVRHSIINVAASIGVIVWALTVGGFVVLGLTSIIKHLLNASRVGS